MPAVAHLTRAAARRLNDAGGPTEADWIRWSGIVFSVVGACITAAGGIAWMFVWSRALAKRGWRSARGQLARLFRSLRRDVRVQGVAAMSATSSLAATETVTSWTDSWTVDQKVAELKSRIETLSNDLGSLRAELRTGLAAQQSALGGAEARLQSDITRLERALTAVESDAARADGRGLIPVALGIILAGVPDGLARQPDLGWAVMALFGVVTTLLAWAAGRDLWRSTRVPSPAQAEA